MCKHWSLWGGGGVAERETGDCETPIYLKMAPIRPKHVVKGNVWYICATNCVDGNCNKYGSTYSWPRHWLEVSGQLHAPAAFTPRESAPGTHWIGCVDPRADLEDNSFPYQDSNSDPSAIQAVASRYTDWAIPASSNNNNNKHLTGRSGGKALDLHSIGAPFESRPGHRLSFQTCWDSTSIRPRPLPSKSFQYSLTY
jgi:hypothetical protein